MMFFDAFKEVEAFHKFVYFRLIAFTRLRRGEALALYVNDIIRSEKAIYVNKTLTEDENGWTYLKHFPKTSESINLVYLDDAAYGYVIELLNNRNSFERYAPELEKRGLHRISPNGFRHSQATLLFEIEVGPKNVQYRLRHKN